jgi:hypothetical protein
MLSVKVEIFIDGRVTHWSPGSETPPPLIVKENHQFKVKIYLGRTNELLRVPRLAVEDHSIQLHRDDFIDEEGCGVVAFSSAPEKVFRESFGLAFLRLFMADEKFSLPFEVLATKVTAIQTERMIRYLAEKREHIIRVCLSRTMRLTGMKDGWSDPEMVLSTAEKIINTLLDCRGELRQQIRSKLVPAKVPAWKAEQSGSLIDPVDVIFNLDSLRPGDGRQDVVLRGRTYSTSAIDVTALVRNTNVEENIILIGGLYSIRRVITSLMDEIGAEFKERQIAAYDKEYVSLGEMLIKLTGGAMYERCERVIFSTENLIRMFENDFGIQFSGEIHPKITPYVRSSRLYRNIFEQYVHWYGLGSPSIDGDLFLIKLRSLSKIFEFFVLFRLFDYLNKDGWKLTNFSLSEEFEKLIPDVMTFEKGQIKIILSYEPNVLTFSGRTSHMELVKLSEYSGSNWKPDYTMRVEDTSNNLVRYLILDAKYSSPYWVENIHIKNLYDKYYDHMAVFDKLRNCISRNQIMGVFAIFPEALDRASRVVNMRFPEFGLDGRGPMMMPMLAGLPISLETDALMEKWLDKALRAIMLSMGATLFSETTLLAAA